MATIYQSDQNNDDQVDASANALDSLTSAAADHSTPPLDHIHAPSASNKSHSWISKLVPQSVVENVEARYHMGNYVIDRQTGQKSFEDMSIYVRLGMHFLYYGSYQQDLLRTKKVEALLDAQSKKMGAQYDAPESKSHIVPFIQSFNLGPSMQEMKREDPNDYATFNDFFSREIKPEARPIDDPSDDLVASSVADCRLTAFPTIDLATKYWIKGTGFTIEHLLQDAQLAQYFDGGSIVIARLAPQDYHRWHSPVTGTIDTIKSIPGAFYTVNPQAINESGTLDVFCENRRDVAIMTRSSTGAKIAVVAVGAMLVGSIKWLPGLDQPGAISRRGECQGYFQYGGSTVITLYPPGEITLDEDLVRNSTEQRLETLMRVGWRVGRRQ